MFGGQASKFERAKRARLAVLVVFFVNGFGFANWIVRIPTVQEKLSLSEGSLGLALLALAGGALATMVLSGGLVQKLGSRPIVGVAGSLFGLSLVLPGLAPSLPLLVLALLVAGAWHGALDVSMNAHAVVVEKEYRRPIMSSFHAAFSLGGLAGAASGGLLSVWGVGLVPHLSGVAVLSLLAFTVASRALLPASADRGEEGGEPAFVRPNRALAGLGFIAFCVLLGEGAMADWSAVYLGGTLGTGPGLAAAGYAVFSLTMAAGRLCGDRLAKSFRPAVLVRGGAALAATGLGVSLAVGHPILALVGFACAGAGFSVVFPNVLSAAGRNGEMPAGAAIAAVSTAGYFGFLVGPSAIGFVAELTGLGAALYIVVGLSAAVAVMAGTLGRTPRSERTEEARGTGVGPEAVGIGGRVAASRQEDVRDPVVQAGASNDPVSSNSR